MAILIFVGFTKVVVDIVFKLLLKYLMHYCKCLLPENKEIHLISNVTVSFYNGGKENLFSHYNQSTEHFAGI